MNVSTNPFFTHGVDKLCTICHVILKVADSSHSIFSRLKELESPGPMNVLQVLQSFSNFNFYNGPQMVCTTCYDKTIEVYKFIQMCNKAHENVQHYLKDVKAIETIKVETDVDVKIEEISIDPIKIIIDGRNCVEEMENEKNRKFDKLGVVVSSTEIKTQEVIIQEGMDTEETSNNEEITISHTECVHSDETPFTCLICKRSFAVSSSLASHTRTHNEVKAHKCEQCDRRFTNASHLRRHMDIHKGVKPHKCEQCDRRFTQAANLRTHMNIHNGVKAHKCEQCDRRFSQASSLRKHMDIHNGVKAHKCEQCDRRFTDASNLRKHIDIHNGVKAHKCEQCNRRFNQAANLRSHMLVHNGIKAHKCEQCDRRFAHASSLRRHLAIHDGVMIHPCMESAHSHEHT